jgi:hypothetical protein
VTPQQAHESLLFRALNIHHLETDLFEHKKILLTTLKGYDTSKRFVAGGQPIGPQ